MKILIAEDDLHIRTGLEQLLADEGYEVCLAADGEQALFQFQQHSPDFVLLDIMMPLKSGYDVCREIRRLDSRVPVVFVSAKSEEIDRVLGLELGADDYIMKPFGTREVVARVRAVARRCLAQVSVPESNEFTLGLIEVSPQQLKARCGGHSVDLSPRDIKILRLFAERAGEVVDRDSLFNSGWGRDYLPSSRTLDQHISKLRKAMEPLLDNERIIETVHGVGYRFNG